MLKINDMHNFIWCLLCLKFYLKTTEAITKEFKNVVNFLDMFLYIFTACTCLTLV